MPSLIFNYGEWTYWDTSGSNPGPMKVTFDGPNKLILINEGETSVDVQADVYSNWKQWSLQRDNTKFLQAISTLGGDPITGSTFVGDTYFLENGWRIQPWTTAAGYIVDIIGNIYTREAGQNPANPTPNVSVTLTRSNITETSIVGGTTTTNRLEEIWKILGLDLTNPQIISDSSITVGGITLSITQDGVAETTTLARQ